MPTSIKFIPDLRIIESIYTGAVTPDELQQSMVNVIKMTIREEAGLILSDLTEMTAGHSVVDIFYFLSQVDREAVKHLKKEALIIPLDPKAAEIVKFYETTAQNRGLNVRIFSAREAAVEWLLQ